MNEKSILLLSRLPARLDMNQTAEILGFLSYEIPVLMRLGLLKPLGRPVQNSEQFIAKVDLDKLRNDREWLSKATAAISLYWQNKNAHEANGRVLVNQN